MIDDLLSAVINGSDEAFIEIWKIYSPKTLQYLKRFSKDAEDLSSEVWIKIASSIKSFSGNGSALQAWIFTIARNCAIDHNRKETRKGTYVELREEDWIGTESSYLDITGLLDRLPQAQAEIILLRVLMGFSVEEVSQITGRTESSVKVLSHRGLNKLKLEIEVSGYEKRDGRK
jgi:RNA polymerase sigma-70 factor (ECF subfamily)